MNISLRSKALSSGLLALLCGCASAPSAAPPVASRLSIIVDPVPAAVHVPPPSLTLEAYKANVARHVVDRNADRIFSGQLPPLIPAIVVVNITVDRDGQMTDLRVQRSRNRTASEVALASMRRSGQLPRPDGLLATNAAVMSFSETFLFDQDYRFQLRTLAGPQQ